MNSFEQNSEPFLFWDFFFIAAYTTWFLALGWITATFFDRPYRAWVAVLIPALITAGADILENLRALEGSSFPMTWNFTSLKWNAAILTLVVLALQTISTWLRFRRWQHKPI
jgi:hypothetical protein